MRDAFLGHQQQQWQEYSLEHQHWHDVSFEFASEVQHQGSVMPHQQQHQDSVEPHQQQRQDSVKPQHQQRQDSVKPQHQQHRDSTHHCKSIGSGSTNTPATLMHQPSRNSTPVDRSSGFTPIQ